MLCVEHPEKVFNLYIQIHLNILLMIIFKQVFGLTEANNYVPGEEGDDDLKQAKISTEGKLEDMLKNPKKYYHLIGSVEQVEQGGIRAKFCIFLKN